MKKFFHLRIVFFFLGISELTHSQSLAVIDSFRIHDDIKVTIDMPFNFSNRKKTIVTFYALPNGNSTEQTMGKAKKDGDDWHFDIQHIAAQTKFIRNQLVKKNFVVIYLENNYKSWPAWKQKHSNFKTLIPHLVDSLTQLIQKNKAEIYLNGHSGGGSFIFGCLAGVEKIPATIKRLSFLDSDYNYDSSYYEKIKNWLLHSRGSAINVFAYNDSIALYNGKPFVSATGGTWYRSYLFLHHLESDITFSKLITDSLIIYKGLRNKAQFFFKINLDRGVYHTQQVALNGFIHSVLCGTKYDSKKYTYYGKRAYITFLD